VQLIGEHHVREDLGFISSFAGRVRPFGPIPGWGGRAVLKTGRLHDNGFKTPIRKALVGFRDAAAEQGGTHP
jgi:hypothetical protein